MRAGDAPVEVVSWVPTLGMDLAFRLGALQWLLALIVSGVGALVLVYCAWYFDDDDPGLAVVYRQLHRLRRLHARPRSV